MASFSEAVIMVKKGDVADGRKQEGKYVLEEGEDETNLVNTIFADHSFEENRVEWYLQRAESRRLFGCCINQETASIPTVSTQKTGGSSDNGSSVKKVTSPEKDDVKTIEELPHEDGDAVVVTTCDDHFVGSSVRSSCS